MLQRLTVDLGQVKADNTSKNFTKSNPWDCVCFVLSQKNYYKSIEF